MDNRSGLSFNTVMYDDRSWSVLTRLVSTVRLTGLEGKVVFSGLPLSGVNDVGVRDFLLLQVESGLGFLS